MDKTMKLSQYIVLSAIMLIIVSPAAVPQDQGNQKLAQTGMKFLSVGMSARQAALADAFTAADGNAVSLFYNPAGMARFDGAADLSLGSVNWIADIKHYYMATAINAGDIGVFGLAFQYVDYGTIQSTILANNSQGFLDVGVVKPNAYSIGIGYARALTDKFSVGGNVKYVRQDLGAGAVNATYTTGSDGLANGLSSISQTNNNLGLFAFDFGLIYRTGFKSMTLGMAVRNFSPQVKYQKESFQLPLAFRIGASMNVFDLVDFNPEQHSLLVVADAEHPRDYPEQVKVGLEYTFMQIISARVGYIGPADEHNLSYGLGLQFQRFAVDYALTPFGIFDSVNRFSVRMWF